MRLHFFKYQGAGNDFVILDNREKEYDQLNKVQIEFLCDRRFGIGADGLMLLNLREGFDFEMKYYNADGRESSMCGNGGRCLVKFAHDRGIIKGEYNFIAIDGPHEASLIDNETVALKMKDVNEIQSDRGTFILNTGSPHYVELTNNVMHLDVYNKGKEIRYSPEFSKEGINVNFVEQTDEPDKIIVRTYERGVENETLSCGTGVTASALVCYHNDNGFNRVEVQTKGGLLSVEYDKNGENFSNIWLNGPAVKVFEGTIEI
ncbi:MAG TPA: diaminopimelate epimerase [Flavisolibacter sp.]|nr:diaminopimelate epimerase [Flavisolibacter sp.]